MSEPRWDALLKEIDSMDTEKAVSGTLSMYNVSRLEEIVETVVPYILSGTQEHVEEAIEVYHAADKLLGRPIGGEDSEPEPQKTVYCGAPDCGEEFTADTLTEAQNMRIQHEAFYHPELESL